MSGESISPSTRRVSRWTIRTDFGDQVSSEIIAAILSESETGISWDDRGAT